MTSTLHADELSTLPMTSWL